MENNIKEEYQEYLQSMIRIGVTEMDFRSYEATRNASYAQVSEMMKQNSNLKISDVLVIATVTNDLAKRNENRG